VEIVPNISIEEGIRQTRRVLQNTLIDETEAHDVIVSLKNYKRKINQATDTPGSPQHDDASHGADNVRYIALSIGEMTNESSDFLNPIRYDNRGII